MRRTPFAVGEKYHIYNRGTEKRKTFLDKYDYQRFIFIMNSFNKIDPGKNVTRSLSTKSRSKQNESPLVRIEHFCLMPNHYHLIVEELEEGGTSKFLQKVMTGYTMYFNKKYKRSGALFQGKTKSNHIDTDIYYNQVRAYVDLNPVELLNKNWKNTAKVESISKTLEFLKTYAWTSCKDFSVYKGFLTGKKTLQFDELWSE